MTMYVLVPVFVALSMVCITGAHPSPPSEPTPHGHGGAGHAETGPHEPVVKRIGAGLVPFPQGVDDLQIFPYQHYLIVTGSKFISIEADNTCWRCEFNEDFNHCIQINQTLCNETLLNGECPDTVAIIDCTVITESSKAGPIYVQVQPFKQHRPSCYITKGKLRLQPVYDSQIYFLQPKLESCNFVLSSNLPAKYVQHP